LANIPFFSSCLYTPKLVTRHFHSIRTSSTLLGVLSLSGCASQNTGICGGGDGAQDFPEVWDDVDSSNCVESEIENFYSALRDSKELHLDSLVESPLSALENIEDRRALSPVKDTVYAALKKEEAAWRNES
jgi:hypothetical protein